MIIVERSDLDGYRFIVGKIVFLRQYNSEYKLIEDIEESSCMKMLKIDTNQIVIVSIFCQPKNKIKDLPVIVFYLKSAFRGRTIKGNSSLELSELFENEYNECIYLALLEPLQFINKYSTDQIDVVKILENAIIAKPLEKRLFKYYSTKIENNVHGQLDGKISFMNPQEFNDPFDCNCFYQNGNPVSNCFRAFCSTESSTNIPMWAYYGEDHKGYCFEYAQADIINALINTNLDVLCIIGNVTYSSKRPNCFLPCNSFSYTNIKKFIDCTFTKYDGWKHEREYRFVLISKSFNANNSAFQVSIPIKDILRGCNNQGKTIRNSSKKPLNTRQLKKDVKNYILTE